MKDFDELICWFLFGGGARMQVEVSKYTEGAKEKARRPNGLPESLIRYDGTIHLPGFSLRFKSGLLSYGQLKLQVPEFWDEMARIAQLF